MDDTVNRLAKELAQAIRAAVAADPTVEACRAKARAAGYEMHLSIDAEVGFANRAKPTAVVKVRRAGAGAVSASGGATAAEHAGEPARLLGRLERRRARTSGRTAAWRRAVRSPASSRPAIGCSSSRCASPPTNCPK